MSTRKKINAVRAKIRRRLVLQVGNDNFKDFAFKISGNVALRDRCDEARPVIIAELKQMMDKQVWHGELVSHHTRNEPDKIIRFSMFL